MLYDDRVGEISSNNAAPDEKRCWKLMHPAHALLSQ